MTQRKLNTVEISTTSPLNYYYFQFHLTCWVFPELLQVSSGLQKANFSQKVSYGVDALLVTQSTKGNMDMKKGQKLKLNNTILLAH